ncbi:putative transporter [Trypanosoma theileri]|uniref:Putative transporter n=1 Tax=Trypanosoma theileri TaxID=67003 RepID=A0A1X0P5R5_9TRYP|nr:putative transporter [Trypanosoma theileri]ORC92188.1 putative transporter [Trypanosoma theileri]
MWRKNQSFHCKVAALSMVLISESISSTLVLPFVGLFVAHLQNITPDEAGFLSGLLVSVFQLGQMLTAKMWGRMSDRFGRKPMIQLGLFFNAAAAAFFGVSTSIEFCVLMRFLHGCANGNVLVAKTVIADITDKSNEGIGFSAISLFWGVGSIVGPSLGGLLYDPGKNPGISQFFPNDEQTRNIFIIHPAMLPTMVITVFSLLVLISTCFFLPETSKNTVDPLLSLCFRRKTVAIAIEEEVEVEERSLDLDDVRSPILIQGENTFTSRNTETPHLTPSMSSGKALDDTLQCNTSSEAGSAMIGMRNRKQELFLGDADSEGSKTLGRFGYREALQTPSTRTVLLMYMCIASTECALLEVIPLWAIASIEKGGLSLTSPDVGWLMGISAVVCVFANINFGPLLRCVQSNRFLWDFSVIVWALTSILTPCAIFFPREWVFTYVTILSSIREAVLSWAYALIYLFVARSAPESHVGAMNGIAQAIGSFSRMLTMLVLPPLFAWSLQSAQPFPFNHHFVFWLTSIPLLLSYLFSSLLPAFILSG